MIRTELVHRNKKPLPAVVLAEVEQIEQILLRRPQIKEARIFGSADTGRWRPGERDVDLAIIVEGNPQEWSAFTPVKRVVSWGEDGEPLWAIDYGATLEVIELTDELVRFDRQLEPHIATEEDLIRIKKEGVPPPLELRFRASLQGMSETALREYQRKTTNTFGDAMMKGRVIYSGANHDQTQRQATADD